MSAHPPVFYGWIVAACACAVMLLTYGAQSDHNGNYFVAFLGGTVINTVVVFLFALARPPCRKGTTHRTSVLPNSL
jgi:hypothetical protein